MRKRVVFLTGEQIGANSAESLHLYKRIVSFKKSGDVAVITQSNDTYAERAGCNKVVHLTAQNGNLQDAEKVANQADMFVIVGTTPNVTPSSELLRQLSLDAVSPSSTEDVWNCPKTFIESMWSECEI